MRDLLFEISLKDLILEHYRHSSDFKICGGVIDFLLILGTVFSLGHLFNFEMELTQYSFS